jgi:transposase
MHGEGRSIRAIAKDLSISRNTVRRYLRSDGVPKPAPRPERPSLLDPFKAHVEGRVAEGADNCEMLLRELRGMGYTGGRTILKEFVHPLRRPREPRATRRFDTEPGEQAQVDFGYFRYKTPDGTIRSIWAFVMVLSWSRAIYVEFIERANSASFIRCHLNAFTHFGGIPKKGLYDNAKVVVIERGEGGEPVLNENFLDFSRRVGFDIRLCRPYRPQTKGRVESGVKYVRHNFWPTARFTDLAGLNRQALEWCTVVADRREHGTTLERPADRLRSERPKLAPLPPESRVADLLREDRGVGRDGFVQWQRSWYGVPWRYAGETVQVDDRGGVITIWAKGQVIATHPHATRPGERLRVPGQWADMPSGDGRPGREALAVQIADIVVERRSLAIYEVAAGVTV